MTTLLIDPEQAKGIAKAAEELEPLRHPDDDLHLTRIDDGTSQVKVELTGCDLKKYVSKSGVVSGTRWDYDD